MPDYLKDHFGGSCDFSDKVGGFHAGMDAEDRKETYEKFKNGEIVILFATKAFGITATPTVMVLDSKNKIVFKKVDVLDETDLMQIRKLVGAQ